MSWVRTSNLSNSRAHVRLLGQHFVDVNITSQAHVRLLGQHFVDVNITSQDFKCLNTVELTIIDINYFRTCGQATNYKGIDSCIFVCSNAQLCLIVV